MREEQGPSEAVTPAGQAKCAIAVVGGGVSGLALARALQRAGHDVRLFEARSRLGGRVESAECRSAPTRVDLGPTCYWPHEQPLMARLVKELSLADFAQHDPGEVVILEKAGGEGRSSQTEGQHAQGRRIAGSMTRLVEALAADIAPERVHLTHDLCGVRSVPNGLELEFEHAGQRRMIEAARLVLALPPRLVAERVRFEPALPEPLQDALRDSPTWMASEAKAVLEFEHASWRDEGHSGNAFVQHEQAVLSEVFDACEPDSKLSALGGFLALEPPDRDRYRAGLPMLLSSQLTQLFGPALEAVGHHYRDWSAEPFTCSQLDLHGHMAHPQHPMPAARLLQDAHWEGRLRFAGTETSERETGYLEGALLAAARSFDALAG